MNNLMLKGLPSWLVNVRNEIDIWILLKKYFLSNFMFERNVSEEKAPTPPR